MSAEPITTLDQHTRDEMLVRMARLNAEISKGRAATPPKSLDELDPLTRQRNEVRRNYFARLPRYVVSRCPYCNEPLRRAIDPWGPDGIWWQYAKKVTYAEPPVCPHFVVITAAVEMGDYEPKGVSSEVYVGADRPFVIPKILNRPDMRAVISCVPLVNGFITYPVAYFAERGPVNGPLTQAWTQKTMDTSGGGWGVDKSEWDFDLQPWAEREKLKWIEPDDDEMKLSDKPARAFPFAKVPGDGVMQIIDGDKVFTQPPPDGEPIEPFE